jgi:hypothetical protein
MGGICCDNLVCNPDTLTCDKPAQCIAAGSGGCDAFPCCPGLDCNSTTLVCAAPQACGYEGEDCTMAPCCDSLVCDASSQTCTYPRTSASSSCQDCDGDGIAECCDESSWCGYGYDDAPVCLTAISPVRLKKKPLYSK